MTLACMLDDHGFLDPIQCNQVICVYVTLDGSLFSRPF